VATTDNSTSSTQPPKFITAIKSEKQATNALISEREESETIVDTPVKNPNPAKLHGKLPMTITSLDKTKGVTTRPSTQEVVESCKE